ncbi:preprotein translocase subunit SecG [Mycoplasmopsis iners]|uniref:preprotein translocase subunit SecG n=1 Tax=Mycoplasmopsis iners TaxID=76630 RepID=UPI0004962DF6|nr:preprotein translocase subunit SecG [Mycoplasmopsis iners]
MVATTVIMIIIAFVIIIVSLRMSPDSNAFSGALVGSSDLELFKNSKERGIKKVLKYSMLLGGIFLLALAVVIRILMK